MSLSGADRYPRYRAPTGDGQTLCVPPWNQARELVADNSEAVRDQSFKLWGTPLAELRREARASLLAAATRYTRSYANIEPPANAERPFVLTGHQPGFAHPGVWLKNFAAAELARQTGGVAISLVIDSDLCRSTSILVPSGDVQSPRSEHVPFDGGLPQMPWEERPLADRATWQSFGARVTKTLASLVPRPLVKEWWPKVVESDIGNRRLAEALSQARHRLELDWGSASLEIPQSVVCQTEAFRGFASLLMADAERFRAVHNEALQEYRQEHQLRNHAQPVPDLASADGWTEAPFWLWAAGDSARRPVFVKRRGQELIVTDRADFKDTLPLPAGTDLSTSIERLGEWESRGVKLRTRALLTTMFARLFLADVFIHGIGGAKYDQVTDEICQRMFGFRPPTYLTLSGTLRLPIPHAKSPPGRERQLHQALRDLAFHPEKLVIAPRSENDGRKDWDALVHRKQKWVETVKTPENAAERHRQIVAANAGLSAWAAPQRDQLQRELSELDVRRRWSQILESREFSFCLFPSDVLRGFLLDFLPGMP